jgi:hypothetical protein
MNEQAIIDSYNVFVSNGYTKSIEEYKKLIATNPQALQDSYDVFVSNGYSKSIDDYKLLMGLQEKKNVPQTPPSQTPPSQTPPAQTPTTQTPTTQTPTTPIAETPPAQQPIQQTRLNPAASLRQDNRNKVPMAPTQPIPTPTPAPAPSKFDPSIFQEKQKPAVSDGMKVGTPDFEMQMKGKQAVEKKKNEFNQYNKTPDFKKGLELINKDLISGTEENAVPLLNYHFEDLGFNFQESGATGDYMIVTAPNKETTEISLDNFFSSKDNAEAERLRRFITRNSKNIDIESIELNRPKGEAKIKDEAEARAYVKDINKQLEGIVEERKIILQEYEALNNVFQGLENTPVEQRDATWQENFNIANEQKAKIIADAAVLDNKRAQVTQREAVIQSSVGRYFAMKGEQGTWYGNLGNKVLDAFGNVTAGFTNQFLDFTPDFVYLGPEKLITKTHKDEILALIKKKGIIMPDFGEGANFKEEEFKDWFNSIAFGDVRRDEIKAEIAEQGRKIVKYGSEGEEGMLSLLRRGNRAVYGDPNTTVQYSDLSKEGFWGGAISALIDFVPAMVGSPIQKAATMYAISNNNMNIEMENNPAFKDMKESDKMITAIPFNIANSVLLEFGLNKIMSNKSITSNLVMASLNKVGLKSTAAELKEVMKGELKNMIANGVINVSKSGLAGAELGVAISSIDVLLKEVYNGVKGKEMFETPKDINEFVKQTAESAASMAVGGVILGMPHALKKAMTKSGYEGMSDDMFTLFELSSKDSNMYEFFVTDVKNKISGGEITKEQGAAVLDNLRNSVGLFNSVPEGLDIAGKKKAMDLLKEKKDLEQKMAGKDPSLVKREQARVDKIKEELSSIAETLVEPTVAEPVVSEPADVTEKRASRIEELESALAEPDNGKGTVTIGEGIFERTELQKELQTLKTEQDAIQKQTAGEVPVQPTEGVSGEVAQGVTEAKPEGVAQEGKTKEEVGKPEVITEPIELQPFDTSAPKEKGKFEQKAEKIAAAIDSLEAPSWLSADLPEGTKTSGMSGAEFKRLVAKSVIEIGRLMDKGVDFADSLKQSVKELVDLLGEEKRTKIEDVVKEYFNKGEGLSEAELPGFDRMVREAEAIVEQKKRGREEAEMYDAVINYVTGSKAYTDATDVQREAIVRYVRERFDLKEKKAPSASKLLGIVKDVTKITMTEMTALKKQFRDLARGGRDAKKALNDASQELSAAVKKLKNEGKITVTQAANVLRNFSKVNLLSQESIGRFTEYMTKVFKDADYAQRLKDAKATKSQLTSLSKNKETNGNLRNLAEKFLKIDPSLVDDIVKYNEVASQIKESIKGSKISGQKLTVAEMVNIEKATEYINEAVKVQNEKLYKFKSEEVQEAMGIDTKGLTYEELIGLLGKGKTITKYNEGIIRATINRMFDINSSVIKSMIEKGVDVFTGEKVSFTRSQVDVVKRFMEMDLNRLEPKEALRAVDALSNFIQNKSTAKMETVVSQYTGEMNIERLFNKKVFGVPLRKYYSPFIGKLLAEQTTTLPALFERIFKGVNRGGMVSDLIGVTKLASNKAFAEKQASNVVIDYVKKFYEKKANGEKFNTAKNNIERGMSAFMMRNVIGSESAMKEEFNRRKNLIKESIEVLGKGNESEVKKSELYKEAYDKIVKDAEKIQDIRDKTDATNLEAVDYWIDKWNNQYEELADVSLNVYNKVLDRDINFNPDRYTRLSTDEGVVKLGNDESLFYNNNDNGNLYKRENGVLMTAKRPEKLPVNEDTKKVSRYIDLSFDRNNSNSLHDALVDMKTAAPIRQIEAAINSEYYKKLFKGKGDAEILSGRIKLYIDNIRGKTVYENPDEVSKLKTRLNRVATFGVGLALGGPNQPLKQVIPVATNTLLNAGSLDMGSLFNSAKNKFIDEAGESVSNRGVQSQAQVEALDSLIKEAANSTPEKAMRLLEQANKMWLQTFLVKPDVFIARASWLTYYEKALKKQGIKPSSIDYNTHVKNQEAADYATRMVDRQQNISDSDMGGKLFTDNNKTNNLFVKTVMPFASFRLNQATRLANDLSVFGHWGTSTYEDKVIALKSLTGFAAEMATFKAISGGLSLLLGDASKVIMDRDETDEEREKRKDVIIKGQATSIVNDVFSPNPILDKGVQFGANYLIDKVQELADIAKDDRVNIYEARATDAIKSLGLLGISVDRLNQLSDLAVLSSSGKFTDNYGNVKYISQKDQEGLSYLIAPAVMSAVGLAPVEVNTVVRTSINDSKKAASTKEGGKSDEDLRLDEMDKEASERNKTEKESKKYKKLKELRKMLKQGISQDRKNAIKRMIAELSASDKESEEEIKNQNRIEKQEVELLLEGYDNKTDMKNNDPDLYERNFGEGSDYYEKYKDEVDVKKSINKSLKEDREKEYKKRKKRSWD